MLSMDLTKFTLQIQNEGNFMIDKFKDFLEEKGAANAFVVCVALIILAVGICFVLHPQNDAKPRQNVSINEEEVIDITPEPVTTSAPAITNENAPATPDATEPVAVKAEENEEASPAKSICEYLESTGDYYDFSKSESDWEIEDLNSFSEQDSGFENLYIYRGYGRYSKDIDGHDKGGEVRFTCYVTKNSDNTATIHYIAREGSVVVNDGFVTDSMMRIMNGDLDYEE